MTPKDFILARAALLKVRDAIDRDIVQLRKSVSKTLTPFALNGIYYPPSKGTVVWHRVGKNYEWFIVSESQWSEGPLGRMIVVVDEEGSSRKWNPATMTHETAYYSEP